MKRNPIWDILQTNKPAYIILICIIGTVLIINESTIFINIIKDSYILRMFSYILFMILFSLVVYGVIKNG